MVFKTLVVKKILNECGETALNIQNALIVGLVSYNFANDF